jgi:hypothetical protein
MTKGGIGRLARPAIILFGLPKRMMLNEKRSIGYNMDVPIP